MAWTDGRHLDDLALDQLDSLFGTEEAASAIRWYSSTVKSRRGRSTLTMADVKEYADFNRAFVEHVRSAKKAGQTVEQAIAWKVPERFLKNGYAQPMPDALRSNAQVVWNELK